MLRTPDDKTYVYHKVSIISRKEVTVQENLQLIIEIILAAVDVCSERAVHHVQI